MAFLVICSGRCCRNHYRNPSCLEVLETFEFGNFLLTLSNLFLIFFYVGSKISQYSEREYFVAKSQKLKIENFEFSWKFLKINEFDKN